LGDVFGALAAEAVEGCLSVDVEEIELSGKDQIMEIGV
jgi:hypothetical protein